MKSSSTPMPTEDLSFICIVDFTDKANWQYLSPSVSDVLGYTPEELVGKSSIALVHPDEQNSFISLHYNTITADKEAALVYIRMKHKVASRGWRLFIIVRACLLLSSFWLTLQSTRTIVHNVVVGSVSLARTPQANQAASTAQEVTTLSPAAADLQFRRWTDPMPSAGNYDLLEAVPPNSPTATYMRPPSQSFRTAFILDRFTHKCTIKYCSNDLIDIDKEDCIGRPFYEYVAQEDEARFKGFIEQVKGWGVNPLGQPCSGGFGYGSFKLLSNPRAYKEPVVFADGGKVKPHKRGTRRSRSSSAAGTSVGLASSMAANGGIIMARPARMAAAMKAVPPSTTPEDDYTRVDAILSAHSDGVLLILRRVKPDSAPFNA